MIKNKLIWVFCLFAIVVFFMFVNKDGIKDTFKCPEEMSSYDEYLDNREQLAKLIQEKYPELSQEEVMNQIMEMVAKEGCSNDVGYFQDHRNDINGEEASITLVSEKELEESDLLEHKIELTFSFKYPTNTRVLTFEDSEEGTSWVVIENKEDENSKIIISIADNSEGITAEEWFLGPNSGFDPNEDIFFRTQIDGQPAVFTDSGTWVVVNTPDGKHRLSIAEMTVEDAKVMYKEMGIILGTLKFN